MGAGELLDQTLPVMLRFLGDEYDDTASTVFPMLTSLLQTVRMILYTIVLSLKSCHSINAPRKITLTLLLKSAIS